MLKRKLGQQEGLEIREAVLPPGLHPTNPPLVTILVYRCPSGPFAPFAMAE